MKIPQMGPIRADQIIQLRKTNRLSCHRIAAVELWRGLRDDGSIWLGFCSLTSPTSDSSGSCVNDPLPVRPTTFETLDAQSNASNGVYGDKLAKRALANCHDLGHQLFAQSQQIQTLGLQLDRVLHLLETKHSSSSRSQSSGTRVFSPGVTEGEELLD